MSGSEMTAMDPTIPSKKATAKISTDELSSKCTVSEPTIKLLARPKPAPTNGQSEPILKTEGGDSEASAVSGIDNFLLTALDSPKDRITLLKLEKELITFMNNEKLNRLQFPPMSSYQRLIVHRVAQHFKLEHTVLEPVRRTPSPNIPLPTTNFQPPLLHVNPVSPPMPLRPPYIFPQASAVPIYQVPLPNRPRPAPIPKEQQKKPVVLWKTPTSQVPEITFKGLLAIKVKERDDKAVPIKNMKIMTRKAKGACSDGSDIANGLRAPSPKPEKSLEEREEEYAKARARIFASKNAEEPDTARRAPSPSLNPPKPPLSRAYASAPDVHAYPRNPGAKTHKHSSSNEDTFRNEWQDPGSSETAMVDTTKSDYRFEPNSFPKLGEAASEKPKHQQTIRPTVLPASLSQRRSPSPLNVLPVYIPDSVYPFPANTIPTQEAYPVLDPTWRGPGANAQPFYNIPQQPIRTLPHPLPPHHQGRPESLYNATLAEANSMLVNDEQVTNIQTPMGVHDPSFAAPIWSPPVYGYEMPGAAAGYDSRRRGPPSRKLFDPNAPSG